MDENSNNNFYNAAEKQLVAVDCIIFGFDGVQLQLLLFKRRVEPFRDQWSLIGSFVESDESVMNAAERVLQEGTGLTNVFLQSLDCYGTLDRDPGARVISIAHYALIRLDDTNLDLTTNYQAKWFQVDEIPKLILDHNQMVTDALAKVRQRAKYQPIAFELLPEKFTIPQLKTFYDAVYQITLDRRNFRKRILAMGILRKLAEKDKTGSKKGAFLYQFDVDQYEALIARGEGFVV